MAGSAAAPMAVGSGGVAVGGGGGIRRRRGPATGRLGPRALKAGRVGVPDGHGTVGRFVFFLKKHYAQKNN